MKKRAWMIGMVCIFGLAGCGERARPALPADVSVYSLEMIEIGEIGTRIVENPVVSPGFGGKTEENAWPRPEERDVGTAPEKIPAGMETEAEIPEGEALQGTKNAMLAEPGKTTTLPEPDNLADAQAGTHPSSIPAEDSHGEIQGAPAEEEKPVEMTPAESGPEGTQPGTSAAEGTQPGASAAEGTQPPASEPQAPKTAYDYEFDINAITADCVEIAEGMGLTHDGSLTPGNAAYWNPVTASRSNQGAALKQSLESYIRFHTVENLRPYGLDQIQDFNIYCEPGENGSYTIYFLFA